MYKLSIQGLSYMHIKTVLSVSLSDSVSEDDSENRNVSL